MGETATAHAMSGLLHRISSMKAEDTVTEVLARLLTVPACADALHQVFGVPAGLPRTGWSVSTQVAAGSGRPDLVVRRPGYHLIVENKLGANLTEKQPKEYLRELERTCVAENVGRLVFCVPARRRVALWQEVTELASAQMEALQPRVALDMVTWKQVHESVCGIVLEDPIERYIHAEFLRLLEDWIDEPVHTDPITEQEADMLRQPEVINSMVALADLIRGTRYELGPRFEVATGGGGADLTWGGFSFGPGSGKRKLWFGYFFRASAALETDHGPLWLQVGWRDAKDAVEASGVTVYPVPPGWQGWGGYLVPIALPEPAESAAAQAADVARRLVDLAEIVFATPESAPE